MAEPDWIDAEETLFKGTRQVLRRFAENHPEEVCTGPVADLQGANCRS